MWSNNPNEGASTAKSADAPTPWGSSPTARPSPPGPEPSSPNKTEEWAEADALLQPRHPPPSRLTPNPSRRNPTPAQRHPEGHKTIVPSTGLDLFHVIPLPYSNIETTSLELQRFLGRYKANYVQKFDSEPPQPPTAPRPGLMGSLCFQVLWSCAIEPIVCTREKVRPVELYHRECATKFAQCTQNTPNSVFFCVLGELCLEEH